MKESKLILLDQKNFNKDNVFNLVIEVIRDKKKLQIKRENMKKIYTDNVYSIIDTKIKEII